MDYSWAIEKVIEIADHLREMTDQSRQVMGETEQVQAWLERMRDQSFELDWAFPIGTEGWPPEDWYVSVVHDLTGAANDGYKHSGIDINLDRWPWGDVERGAPVMACSGGTVVAKGSSAGWLGVLLIRHFHEGLPIYVRYAHLDPDRFEVVKGEIVQPGQVIGYLGDYQRGDTGDHLHLDMADEPFAWNWWLTGRIHWIDPVPVLKAHLDPERVEAMLQRR